MRTLNYNAVLDELRYKPNFAYRAYMREKDEWWIRIIMIVENSRAPWKMWEVRPTPQDDEVRYWDLLRHLPAPPSAMGYSPSREVIEVVGNYPIPFFDPGDELIFVEWFKRTLREMEMHELDEWLRYKGELLHDPHH